MIENHYTLPFISLALELLQGACVFTKPDLRNVDHLVHICNEDEWKTVFNTPSGHYEHRVMSFGVADAPTVFQALVHDVLLDTNQFVFVSLLSP